ncbi:MAG: pyridoxamine 5'-phosphate oxidase family protein [Chloroflexi bacterium]|nr:pyridoxamine 5'-phosphate oxidase family protein [Chloroflexota bacterium]
MVAVPEVVKVHMNLPVMAMAASRDANLRPNITRVFGMTLHPNQSTITFYIPETGSEQIIKNLEDNGRVALTINTPGDNDSYQLKGRFVSWRRNNEQDDQCVDYYVSKLFEHAVKMGFPADYLSRAPAFKWKPGIAVTFDVESVFGQAPHPNTGQQIA